MAAANYSETARAIAENDGGISEFGYNPKTGRVEFETAEGREVYMSPAEVGVYGEDVLTEEDLELEEVQEMMNGIEQLYQEAEAREDVGKLTGEELEPVDGSVSMEDGEFNYPQNAESTV